MKIPFFLICLFGLASFSTYCQTQNHHRAKIFYHSQKDLQKMNEAGIALDHAKSKKNVFVESDFSDFEINTAKELGLDVEIIIPNVSEYYVRRNKGLIQDIERSVSRNAQCENESNYNYDVPVNYDIKSGTDFGGFYTYAEMLQELDDMHAQYPDLISARADLNNPSSPTTHQTEEGRYLQWVKISDNPNTEESEPQILFDAIHHAREPASLQQLIFFMWYLLENYSTDNEIKDLVDNTEIYFIPCINPDGYIYNETTNPSGGGLWRKNRRGTYGVDNNRNYSYITPQGNEVWNTVGTSNITLGETYAGTGPFSEPENQAIRYFVETHDFKIALNSHTYGNLLLFPYGYANNTPTSDNTIFENITSIMVAQNNFDNKISSELYPAAGDSDDFMYGMLQTENGGTRNKVFAMTPEIGPSFWPNAIDIVGICQDMADTNLNALKLIHNYGLLTDLSADNLSTANPAISYQLERLGLADDGSFNVSIEPISTNISSVGASDTFSNLSQGEIVSGDITLNLNSGMNPGDLISFDFVLDHGLFETRTRVSKIYGSSSLLLEDPADSVSVNWDSTSWGTTSTEYVSSSTSITDSPNGNYLPNTDSSIQLSNPIDLSSGILDARVAFMAQWDLEAGFDYVQLEVSIDGGNSWIPQCGRYTRTGVVNQSGAEGEPIYEGTQSDWVRESISLNDYLGENVLFRFKLHSDEAVELDGFYFDDLTVSVVSQNLYTTEFTTDEVHLYPNPTSGMLYVQTTLENFNIQISNILGKVVFQSQSNSGHSEVSMQDFAAGLYFVSLFNQDRHKKFKVIKK